jgi:hypothetical protein
MRHFTATLEFTTDFNLAPIIGAPNNRLQIRPFTIDVLVDPGGPRSAKCVDVKDLGERKWELHFEYDEKATT